MLIVWASFGAGVSSGSSGVYMIVGTVASVLLVAIVITIAATHAGLRTIIVALFAAVFAAIAGWIVYSSMPEAGPGQYITHRAGVAALAYGFGVIGGGLLALSEFVVEGYAGGRIPAPRQLRRKVAVLSVAITICSAAALAPAMQRGPNSPTRTSRRRRGRPADAGLDGLAELAGVERFTDTPYGLLRTDHPAEPTPQAVTMLDPATGAAIWYHRRWNWLASQPPVLSQAQNLVALTGPRADNTGDFQTRILRARDGDEIATADFDGSPGALLALAEDRLLFAKDNSEIFSVYDFSGDLLWDAEMPTAARAPPPKSPTPASSSSPTACPPPTGPSPATTCSPSTSTTATPPGRSEIDKHAEVVPQSFLVTEDTIVLDCRIEHRVTDGPFSARRFEHRLISYAIADGAERWRVPTRRSAPRTPRPAAAPCTCPSRPSKPRPASPPAAAREGQAPCTERRTVQIIECYSAKDREGSWLGVMAFDADSGDRLTTTRCGWASPRSTPRSRAAGAPSSPTTGPCSPPTSRSTRPAPTAASTRSWRAKPRRSNSRPSGRGGRDPRQLVPRRAAQPRRHRGPRSAT